jgi:hypothetical protein
LDFIVPPFIITDKKTEIFEENVVKAISDVFTIHTADAVEKIYAEELSEIMFDDFFVSLIQKKIKAKYEVRTVVVNS